MSELIKGGRAWVRGVPDRFDRAITGSGGRPPIVGLAREQHHDYVGRLEASGVAVTLVAGDEAHPDCVFIEDTAVLVGHTAIAARPGAKPRRGEVPVVMDELGEHFARRDIRAPATLDGGDVIVLGDKVYVGHSGRTNQAGISQLMAFATEAGKGTISVEVSGVLHLKSGVLPVGNETIVVTPGTVDEELFDGLEILYEDEAERHRFSALPLGDRVLVTSQAPATARSLERLGFDVDPIDVSEILAADGGLTCLSIIDR